LEGIALQCGLKTDLDIRPIYHKTDDGSKARLHLALLAYRVVSSSRYQSKKAGIHHEWSEIVRILSTRKTVSTRMQQSDNGWIEIRQCTLPSAEVKTICDALHIKEEPCRRRKFVWHPERPPENMAADLQAVDTGLLEMWGKTETDKINGHKVKYRYEKSKNHH
jgi:hypothetical protein